MSLNDRETKHTRNESQSRDDQVTNTDFEQPVPCGTVLTIEANLLEHDILVEIDTVETGRGDQSQSSRGRVSNARNVKEEPANGGTDEKLQMAPFGEVMAEF